MTIYWQGGLVLNNFSKEMEMILYHSDDGDVSVNAYIKDETLWITQKAMAELFGVQVPAISKHLKNIFHDGELEEQVVVSKMEITTPHGAIDGKTQTMEAKFYNLDAIISVGYRVNSKKATHFRIWATKILKEYMQKGFVLDDDRLKQGKAAFGKDYFRELLERVRSIRASERRIWQQITDIFAECSIDYTKDSEILKDNGRISHKQALEKAFREYDIFNKIQPIESDFDKAVKQMMKNF